MNEQELIKYAVENNYSSLDEIYDMNKESYKLFLEYIRRFFE